MLWNLNELLCWWCSYLNLLNLILYFFSIFFLSLYLFFFIGDKKKVLVRKDATGATSTLVSSQEEERPVEVDARRRKARTISKKRISEGRFSLKNRKRHRKRIDRRSGRRTSGASSSISAHIPCSVSTWGFIWEWGRHWRKSMSTGFTSERNKIPWQTQFLFTFFSTLPRNRRGAGNERETDSFSFIVVHFLYSTNTSRDFQVTV